MGEVEASTRFLAELPLNAGHVRDSFLKKPLFAFKNSIIFQEYQFGWCSSKIYI